MQTPKQSQGNLMVLPVAAATTIECGTIVCADGTTKLATPGADTAGLLALGIADHDANNSTGAAGAITVAVNRRVTRLINSATHPVAQADLGKLVYVQDANTVSKTALSHGVIAGVMVGLSDDASEVDVDFSQTPAIVALLALGATLYAPHA